MIADLFAREAAPTAAWLEVNKGHRRFIELADRHYTRQTPGSNQACRPGVNLTLLLSDGAAAWNVWRPIPEVGRKDGLEAWECTLFRNEGGGKAQLRPDPRGGGADVPALGLASARRAGVGGGRGRDAPASLSSARPGLVLPGRRVGRVSAPLFRADEGVAASAAPGSHSLGGRVIPALVLALVLLSVVLAVVRTRAMRRRTPKPEPLTRRQRRALKAVNRTLSKSGRKLRLVVSEKE